MWGFEHLGNHRARAITDVRPRRTDAEHERVVMLSFPNSGTSYLLQVAACFAGPQQCTAYRAECEATSQGNHVRHCVEIDFRAVHAIDATLSP